jgi:hypothetical protein
LKQSGRGSAKITNRAGYDCDFVFE